MTLCSLLVLDSNSTEERRIRGGTLVGENSLVVSTIRLYHHQQDLVGMDGTRYIMAKLKEEARGDTGDISK